MEPEQQASSKGSTIGFALLFGVVGGSLASGVDGFVFGAMFGALLAQVLNLHGRTRSLELQLRTLRQSLKDAGDRELAESSEVTASSAVHDSPVPGAEPTADAPATPASALATARISPEADVAATFTSSAAEPAPSAQERERISTEAGERRQAEQAAAFATVAASASRPAQPSAFDRAVEQFTNWLKGGNPLARVGIVILFFGATFLAKYAAENSLFPIELRFASIAVGAFALLGIGWRLRERRAVYAQLLQGGGIAGLYLTVFAATKLYQLLPIGLAFGLMVIIALAAAVIAVGQNSLSLAVIGTAGGFLAPILVSTGSGNYVALFSYYAILNLGVFAVAWFRTWKVLNVLGFVFTFTITGLWRASGYESGDLFNADAFLILFFLMYVGVSILNCVRQPPDLKGYVSGSLVFGLPIVVFALHASMVSRIEYALAWSALAFGAFYLLLGFVVYRTRRESFHLLVEAFAALGVIFASLSIPLAFDTRTTAAMWAVEGAGLLWLGVRQERKLARAFGALLQAAAGVGYLIGLRVFQGDLPVLNSAYLGTLMLSISGLCSGYWLFRHRERLASYETGAEAVFTLWAVAWWYIGGGSEILRFLNDASYGASLAFTALTSVLLAWVSLQRQWRLPLLIATYLPAVIGLIALLEAADHGHPSQQWGAIGWPLLLIVQMALLRLGETREVHGLNWFHAGVCWMVTLIVAWEASWQIADWTTGVWSRLPWGVAPALVVAWVSRRQLRPRWPLAAHEHAYRMMAATPLVIAMALWSLVMNFTSTGEAAWLPYLPVLNPLDISVALCFAAAALWWSSLDERQQAACWQFEPRFLVAIVAALSFVWLNAALIRCLHHNFDAPITWSGMAHSTLVQASLSIFWGVIGFAAMTLAARRHWRYVWMAGCSLMVVVVAKLIFVDLSNVGTIGQITSYLTVGALLLVTGYVAPLPPRDAKAQAVNG